MLSADLALALLINRTAVAYNDHRPAYITYRERTHVSASSLGRTQDINRTVMVRESDNVAIMQDLPQGAQRTGQAFPIIPYFDPFAEFSFGYFANMKRVDINLTRKAPYLIRVAPQTPANSSMTVGYFNIWNPVHDSDSSDQSAHISITPTPLVGSHDFYPSEVIEDAQTHLPKHVELRTPAGDEIIGLDYAVLEGHWVVTHGTFTSPQRVGPLTFTVVADVTYDQFTFPTTAPDPRLQ
ncbi:MAG: hypothetical protein JO165_06505 [Candidatus Eremiobacteraeota bacterium]|nr:hypothetical protein [Candidatus Eremiobacteraeota bacterium]